MNALLNRWIILVPVASLALGLGGISRGFAAADSTTASAPAPATDPSHLKLYVGPDCKTLIKDRFISTSRTYVYSYFSDGIQEVTPAETARLSRFESDIKIVVGSLIGTASAAPGDKCVNVVYTLQNRRATLKLTPVAAKDADKDSVSAISVITGPEEHAFLGLDLPVNNFNTLKYDSTSHTLQPQNSNPQLYLSINGLWGDIASDPSDVEWYKRFALKGLILASSRPQDSYGVGVGYRLPDINIGSLNFSLSNLSIFGAYFRTKQDAIVNGTAQTNGATATGWRVGVTYDVASAIKWVKW